VSAQVGRCATCPWRPENATRVYLLWGELPTPGARFSDVWKGPHYCHETLAEDGEVTPESHRCLGTSRRSSTSTLAAETERPHEADEAE